MQYTYTYNKQKIIKLKTERGVDFEDIINAINKGNVLDIIPHHNQKIYPNQKIIVIEIESYIYLVPYIEKGNELFLKTIFPSRKFTKVYLAGGKS